MTKQTIIVVIGILRVKPCVSTVSPTCLFKCSRMLVKLVVSDDLIIPPRLCKNHILTSAFQVPIARTDIFEGSCPLPLPSHPDYKREMSFTVSSEASKNFIDRFATSERARE